MLYLCPICINVWILTAYGVFMQWDQNGCVMRQNSHGQSAAILSLAAPYTKANCSCAVFGLPVANWPNPANYHNHITNRPRPVVNIQ